MTAGKSKVFFAAAVTCLAIGAAPPPAPPTPIRVEVSQLQMGVKATLTVYAPDLAAGRTACARAFERVRELNGILSDYDPDSELRRLVARAGTGPVPVSADLFRVLAAARELAVQTGGQVDPTVGPLVQLWREARRAKKLPDPAALAAARTLTGYHQLILDTTHRTVALARPGMKLDLGAIAKGFAGDEAIAVLRAAGYPCAMFEAGGDMVFGDAPPGAAGWPVEVLNPARPRFEMANGALSVSGAIVQFAEIEGRRYSHVIDPTTGYGLTNHLMCVVKAPRGLLSDPLCTGGTLMTEPAFRALLAHHYPGVQAWVLPAPASP